MGYVARLNLLPSGEFAVVPALNLATSTYFGRREEPHYHNLQIQALR